MYSPLYFCNAPICESMQMNLDFFHPNSVLSEEPVTTIKCTDRLIRSFLDKSDKVVADHQNTTENFSLSVKIPVEVDNTKSGVVLMPDKKDTIENKQLFVVSDFQSFVSPLEEDYTKSSKGYSLMHKSFEDKMKSEDNCDVLNECNFPNIDECVDSDEPVESDDENYDPAHDAIISRYFDSVQSSSSESELSNDQIIDDYDSDNSVVFCEDIQDEEESSKQYSISSYKKIELSVSFWPDSDSDEDDAEFHEQRNKKCMQKMSKASVKSTCDTKNELIEQNSTSDSDQSTNDSDNDNSVVFSENCAEDMQDEGESPKQYSISKYDKKLCFSIWHDNDSDDDAELNKKCMQKMSKANVKSICYAKNELTDLKNNKELQVISYSLSQSKMHFYSSDFEGFANPCFKDIISHAVSLRNVNNKWESSMQDISSEPRHPKKVSFLPLPDLVSVQTFEPDDDGYKYSVYVLDQVRFRNRISEFEEIMKPYLSTEHRENVYRYYSSIHNNNAGTH